MKRVYPISIIASVFLTNLYDIIIYLDLHLLHLSITKKNAIKESKVK